MQCSTKNNLHLPVPPAHVDAFLKELEFRDENDLNIKINLTLIPDGTKKEIKFVFDTKAFKINKEENTWKLVGYVDQFGWPDVQDSGMDDEISDLI